MCFFERTPLEMSAEKAFIFKDLEQTFINLSAFFFFFVFSSVIVIFLFFLPGVIVKFSVASQLSSSFLIIWSLSPLNSSLLSQTKHSIVFRWLVALLPLLPR